MIMTSIWHVTLMKMELISKSEIWDILDEQQHSYNHISLCELYNFLHHHSYAIWCIRTGAATYHHHSVLAYLYEFLGWI